MHDIQMMMVGWTICIVMISLIRDLLINSIEWKKPRKAGVVEAAFRNATQNDSIPFQRAEPLWGERERELFGYNANDIFIAKTQKILDEALNPLVETPPPGEEDKYVVDIKNMLKTGKTEYRKKEPETPGFKFDKKVAGQLYDLLGTRYKQMLTESGDKRQRTGEQVHLAAKELLDHTDDFTIRTCVKDLIQLVDKFGPEKESVDPYIEKFERWGKEILQTRSREDQWREAVVFVREIDEAIRYATVLTRKKALTDLKVNVGSKVFFGNEVGWIKTQELNAKRHNPARYDKGYV